MYYQVGLDFDGMEPTPHVSGLRAVMTLDQPRCKQLIGHPRRVACERPLKVAIDLACHSFSLARFSVQHSDTYNREGFLDQARRSRQPLCPETISFPDHRHAVGIVLPLVARAGSACFRLFGRAVLSKSALRTWGPRVRGNRAL
jgi:hypothetical protein